jgi:hypothetical protein
MASKRYRNKRCGYCGADTGPNGEGEHVLSKCFYPDSTDPKMQVLKIPACPKCNHSWEKDEAHFRTSMVACGLDITPQRTQLWETSVRSFDKPISGRGDVWAIASQLVSSPILNEYGRPYQRIFPCRDPRVVRVLKKIIRGLAYSHRRDVIADERVAVTARPLPLPIEIHEGLAPVYTVPHVFKSRAYFSDTGDFHSFWVLEFFDNVRLMGWIWDEVHHLPNSETARLPQCSY